ncbi:MAG: hypothetical protein C0501_19070 [Isosphaera sp.]|nr:hypothetical protein [Isosphaera sp.]
MYGMVMMVAVTGSGDSAGFGKRNNGCDGGGMFAGNGCSGMFAGGGCSGRGGFLGMRSGGGLFGKHKGNGCDGGAGCHGGYNYAGGFGCTGSYAAPVYTAPGAGCTGVVPGAPAHPMPGPDGKKSLWDRLGGEKAVRAVVHDFVGAAATDPKVNFFRDGKYKLDAKGVERLEQLLVEFVSAAAGGPLKYTGRDMKTSHTGMKITDAEFGALAGHLVATLKKFNVPQAEIDELVKAVAGTKGDIVGQ